MRVFITGGTGFIGSSLSRALIAHDHQVTVLSRSPETVVLKCGPGVETMGHLEQWTSDRRYDAVVNLAGAPIIGPPWTERRRQILWNSRVTLTERLVETMLRAEATPSVFISGSAVGVYGDQADRILTEESTGSNGFGQRLCAAWEEAALKAESAGIRTCLLRTGLVLGSEGGFLQRMLLPFRLGLGGRLGNGRQWMSWIHLADHIAMIEHLLNAPDLAGPFNATGPLPVTNRDFTACLAGLLGRPALLPIPAPLLRAMGEMGELLLASQRALPARMTEANFRFRFETLETALKDILGAG